MNVQRQSIPVIVDRHAEDAAFLWLLRDAAVGSPHYTLKDLADLDNRLDAHIDGLRVAGQAGWDVCKVALEIGEPGEVFVAAVLAFDSSDGKQIDAVIETALLAPENFRALISALGWVDFQRISGLVQSFLGANSVTYRRLGIAAAAIHRQHPGPILQQSMESGDPLLRMRALKAAGELQCHDSVPMLREHWHSDDTLCAFWSAWSSLLLGDRQAIEPLVSLMGVVTDFRSQTFRLVVRLLDGATAHNWLKDLWQVPTLQRHAVAGCGACGDPSYIPALIRQMEVPKLARVAGEAFTMITGVDLAYENLEGEEPEGFAAGPTENPEDEDVALDPDEDLPWPETALVQQWWGGNKDNFKPGTRYLVGQPVSQQQCVTVLGSGFQRQRSAAALELVLLQAGAPYFETRAPGFRQQRLLGQGW